MSDANLQDICPTHLQKTRTLIAALTGESRGMALNLGCGTGKHTQLLSAEGFKVISTDIDIENLKTVKKISENVVLADASMLPFKQNAFDLLSCIDVLEHVEKEVDCLAEIKRTVRPQGTVILSVLVKNYPFAYDPINKIRTLLKLKPLPIGLYAWGHRRLYGAEIHDLVQKKFEVQAIWKKSSWLIALLEWYWPYLFVYHFKKFIPAKTNENGAPAIVASLAQFICLLDDLLFCEALGYINIVFKLKNPKA